MKNFGMKSVQFPVVPETDEWTWTYTKLTRRIYYLKPTKFMRFSVTTVPPQEKCHLFEREQLLCVLCSQNFLVCRNNFNDDKWDSALKSAIFGITVALSLYTPFRFLLRRRAHTIANFFFSVNFEYLIWFCDYYFDYNSLSECMDRKVFSSLIFEQKAHSLTLPDKNAHRMPFPIHSYLFCCGCECELKTTKFLRSSTKWNFFVRQCLRP